MNKAFVREPDSTNERCPDCGSHGRTVGSTVLDKYVRTESRESLGETASFCTNAKCDIVYFDVFERCIRTTQMIHSVYPKDHSAPICACFQLKESDIDLDLEEGQPTRVRQLLTQAESPEARCAELAADGHSCVSEVQKYYLSRSNKTPYGK
ncbi:MAG: hypothetical protein VX435_03815 [Planctomycetota bacterium]|nr:hypothetical protein [Planctomycetota bacterium]